jgi:GTP pyrophosphokinase
MGFMSPADLFYKVYLEEIPDKVIHKFSEMDQNDPRLAKDTAAGAATGKFPKTPVKLKSKQAVAYNMDDLNFGIATCCHPLPGDEIIAYTPDGDHWIVHRTNCVEAIELMARFANRIIHASWSNKQMNMFLGGVKISGFDRKSMISDIINVISNEMHFNIRSFHIDTSGELYEAYLSFFVHDSLDINRTVERIKQIDGVSAASRMIKFMKT